MKRQFLHEAHNRQDKARKPDYRGGGSNTLSVEFQTLMAKERERRRMRKSRFFLNGHEFKIGYSLSEFARVNGLPEAEPATRKAFDEIRFAACNDLEILWKAIMKGSAGKIRVFTIPSTATTPGVNYLKGNKAFIYRQGEEKPYVFICGWSLDAFAHANKIKPDEATFNSVKTVAYKLFSDQQVVEWNAEGVKCDAIRGYHPIS